MIEHIVYGSRRNPEPLAGLLARSAGVSRACLTEVALLCDRWGDPSSLGTRRPALLSVPLQARLEALPGRLFCVVRTMPGSGGDSLLHHVLMVPETGYLGFCLNPYALALEGPFLDGWAGEERLRRIDVRPTSLAPLVSPLPSGEDARALEEAVRQMLGRGKLLLPLQAPSAASDRFLALLLAALPVAVKRDLRFASFCGTDAVGLTLAAVSRPGHPFEGWQRLLLAADPDLLAPELEEYVHEAGQCLVRGDLLALDRLGRRRRSGGLSRSLESPSETPAGFGLVPTAPPSPTAPASPPAAGRRPTPRRRRPVPPPARAHPATAVRQPASPTAMSPRARSARRSGRGGRGSLWWLALIGLGVVLLGALLGLFHLPGAPGGPGSLAEMWQSGGMELSRPPDVGLLYRSGISVGEPGSDLPAGAARARALAALEPAAGELKLLAANLLVLAGRDLVTPADPGRERERLSALAARLEAAEAEARRLVLYRYSLRGQQAMPELPELGLPDLASRWDRLLARDRHALQEAADALELRQLPDELAAARGGLVDLDRLAALWAAPRGEVAWAAELRAAAERLPDAGAQPAVATWRESALVLAALWQAEAAQAARAPAYCRDYLDGAWRIPPYRAAVAQLASLVAGRPRGHLPPVVTAAADWTSALQRLTTAAAAGQQDVCVRLLDEVEGNLVMGLGPGDREDHLDRLRVEAVRVLVAGGADPMVLPAALFPGGYREATLAFLDAIGAMPAPPGAPAPGPATTAGLRELAVWCPEPFLSRWAAVWAERSQERAVAADARLAAACAEAADEARRLIARPGGTSDWTDSCLELRRHLERLADSCRVRFAGATAGLERARRLQRLAADLAMPVPLPLREVTVRLAPDGAAGPVEVVLELWSGEELVLLSAPLAMGPAAPAGSGWVGTVTLDQRLEVSPGQPLRAVVRPAAGGPPLLAVAYGSAPGEAAPGALLFAREGRRPGAGEMEPARPGGSLVFRADAGPWRVAASAPPPGASR